MHLWKIGIRSRQENLYIIHDTPHCHCYSHQRYWFSVCIYPYFQTTKWKYSIPKILTFEETTALLCRYDFFFVLFHLFARYSNIRYIRWTYRHYMHLFNIFLHLLLSIGIFLFLFMLLEFGYFFFSYFLFVCNLRCLFSLFFALENTFIFIIVRHVVYSSIFHGCCA